MHKASTIIVQQVQSPETYLYFYQVFVNGKQVVNILNDRPQIFNDVKYYASDPWHNPAKATITNFKLVTYEHKGKLKFNFSFTQLKLENKEYATENYFEKF